MVDSDNHFMLGYRYEQIRDLCSRFEFRVRPLAASFLNKSRTILCIGTVKNEQDFLRFQAELRKERDDTLFVLAEAMYSLDCVDTKSQSLLGYISVYFAALVFLLGDYNQVGDMAVTIYGIKFGTLILLLLTALSIAVVLCLSCLNIIGAHTVRNLKKGGDDERRKEYHEMIIKTTLFRRTRYLIAHRISVATAVVLGVELCSILFSNM